MPAGMGDLAMAAASPGVDAADDGVIAGKSVGLSDSSDRVLTTCFFSARACVRAWVCVRSCVFGRQIEIITVS